MIFDANNLPSGAKLQCDVCVIGSGAGGSAAAMVAAEAGLNVVVLEAGGFVTPEQSTQREEEMFKKLLWQGGTRTTKDKAVKIHQGLGVGGSTLHNINLCKRIPEPILKEWLRDRGLRHLPLSQWNALYDEVETLLTVTEVPLKRYNRHNQLLVDGCKSLGWRGGPLKHNRTNCVGSGFCELGCAFDAKNNALKVLVPRILRAKGEIITHAQAVNIEAKNGRATSVEVATIDPVSNKEVSRFNVEAKTICVAASATGSPALLLNSKIPDPSGTTGKTLRIHPAVFVAGDFEEKINAWQGIPQTFECTQWLDFENHAHDRDDAHRLWIIAAFAHPMGTATILPGHGEAHSALMRRYAHTAVLTAMLHDETTGSVEPDGDLGLKLDYWPNEKDRKELMFGAWACAKLLFAAGAKSVTLPVLPLKTIHAPSEAEAFKTLDLKRGMIDITAVHPMASIPMGDDAAQAAVDSRGKHHHLDGLWVADGSLFPTSIGVPPQLSIYAMGLHVGRHLVASMGVV